MAWTLDTKVKIHGWVEDGNVHVVTTGNAATTSDNPFQRSYPSATVTVYDAGTTDLSTIYADSTGTAKANPFTAASDGKWYFYADDDVYDVRFSGGGIPVPFTIGELRPGVGDEGQVWTARWGRLTY